MTFQLALSTAPKIGWIGTGVMGSSMCGHVLAAGYRVSLCSRTKAKAQPLISGRRGSTTHVQSPLNRT